LIGTLARLLLSSLYQIQQTTHQQHKYQFHIISTY